MLHDNQNDYTKLLIVHPWPQAIHPPSPQPKLLHPFSLSRRPLPQLADLKQTKIALDIFPPALPQYRKYYHRLMQALHILTRSTLSRHRSLVLWTLTLVPASAQPTLHIPSATCPLVELRYHITCYTLLNAGIPRISLESPTLIEETEVVLNEVDFDRLSADCCTIKPKYLQGSTPTKQQIPPSKP
jgi:hypothetical protein